MTRVIGYLLPVGVIANRQLAEIPGILSQHPRKNVAHVEIGELARLSAFPNGVYLLYEAESGRLLYVGKATSRSFIDRIPAHFDPREGAWMNSLPKRIRDRQNCSYREALEKALTLELLLVGCDESLPGGQVEAVFRAFLKPHLNHSKRQYKPGLTLDEACRSTD